MPNSDFVQELVAPYGPKLPIDQLVVELNKLYHSVEAKDYDGLHPEVHEQLPPFWAQMIHTAVSESGKAAWNILDFGCGTGFEALQIIEKLGSTCIGSLTCYDPSPEMLTLCRQKIGTRIQNVRFCTRLSEVMKTDDGYDLLATNSLLHHLPSWAEELRRIEPTIKRDAWWLMGHEPSRRYYRNDECSKALSSYRRQARFRKLTDPRACYRSLQRLLTIGDFPAETTARAALKNGLFSKRPSASLVARLVDFNVPRSSQEAIEGRGFDFEEMTDELGSCWRLRWVKTYAFMGPFVESGLPRQWRNRSEKLSLSHPLDGANFCSVWSHT